MSDCCLRYLQDHGTMLMLIRYSDSARPVLLRAQAYAAGTGASAESAARRAARNLGAAVRRPATTLMQACARQTRWAMPDALKRPLRWSQCLRINVRCLSLRSSRDNARCRRIEENNSDRTRKTRLQARFEQAWSVFAQRSMRLAPRRAHSRQASAGARRRRPSLEAQPLAGDKARPAIWMLTAGRPGGGTRNGPVASAAMAASGIAALSLICA